MYNNNWLMSQLPNFPWGLIGLLALVELLLKGFALWRAARNGHKYWFIALLVINSVGILPAAYLLTNPEKKSKKK